MGCFILTQLFSILIQLIRIGRMSDHEKEPEIIILRYQLDMAERKLQTPLKSTQAEKLILTVLVNAADVAVTDLARQLDLGPEASSELVGLGDVGPQHLDRHHLFESSVVGLVHEPHATLADEPEDLVARGEQAALGQNEQARPTAQAGVAGAIVLDAARRALHGAAFTTCPQS